MNCVYRVDYFKFLKGNTRNSAAITLETQTTGECISSVLWVPCTSVYFGTRLARICVST